MVDEPRDGSRTRERADRGRGPGGVEQANRTDRKPNRGPTWPLGPGWQLELREVRQGTRTRPCDIDRCDVVGQPEHARPGTEVARKRRLAGPRLPDEQERSQRSSHGARMQAEDAPAGQRQDHDRPAQERLQPWGGRLRSRWLDEDGGAVGTDLRLTPPGDAEPIADLAGVAFDLEELVTDARGTGEYPLRKRSGRQKRRHLG